MYIRTALSSSLFVAHIRTSLSSCDAVRIFSPYRPRLTFLLLIFFSHNIVSTRPDPNTPDTDALASETTGLSSPTGIEAISSASSFASPDIKDAPIGLSDPQYVGHRRQMLDYVNRLRATG